MFRTSGLIKVCKICILLDWQSIWSHIYGVCDVCRRLLYTRIAYAHRARVCRDRLRWVGRRRWRCLCLSVCVFSVCTTDLRAEVGSFFVENESPRVVNAVLCYGEAQLWLAAYRKTRQRSYTRWTHVRLLVFCLVSRILLNTHIVDLSYIPICYMYRTVMVIKCEMRRHEASIDWQHMCIYSSNKQTTQSHWSKIETRIRKAHWS